MAQSSYLCPSCSAPLNRREAADAFVCEQCGGVAGETELDGCVSCQLLWFDASELAALGIELKKAPTAALADVRNETLRETARIQSEAGKIHDLLLTWLWEHRLS